MKNISSLILVLLIALSGCSTRATPHRVFNDAYQTPEFSISNYKSPEMRSKEQQEDVSVAVAISGGGHRAANFGIGVLKELELIKCGDKNILNEVDYFSTVSGGGLAAGVYISTLYDHIHGPSKKAYSLTKLINENVSGISRNLEIGYHKTLIEPLINLKSLGNNDRGDFLEEEFDKKLLGYTARKRSLIFRDIFIPNDENSLSPTVPMWVANATVYENGSIFPFHPEAMKQYKITRYTHHLDYYDLRNDSYSMPLSVGLKASASFPMIVPATTLKSEVDPKNEYLHLFDGGLSDNLGVFSALQMLQETGTNKKVLLVIDAYKGQPEPFSKWEGSPTIPQILIKTTGISLDTWHIRHKALIEKLSNSNEKKIEVVYLSFDALPNKPNYPTDLKSDVNKIGTFFNISTENQGVLFEAAKYIVEKNSSYIKGAVFGKKCGSNTQ